MGLGCSDAILRKIPIRPKNAFVLFVRFFVGVRQ